MGFQFLSWFYVVVPYDISNCFGVMSMSVFMFYFSSTVDQQVHAVLNDR